MTYSSFNHIRGKNGSQWSKFMQEVGLDRILIVAIDAAKFTHKAMISNFFGDILHKPFEFDASTTGYEKLKQNIQKTNPQKDNDSVVIGIETTGHYYEDLTRNFQEEGFHVRIVNAATTKEERKAVLNASKTDNIDLMAITKVVINGYGNSTELRSGKLAELQTLTRARRGIVQDRTALKNEIRVYVDYIFREFQGKTTYPNGKRTRIKPFSTLFGKAPRYIMRHCLHPSDILALGEQGLRALSIQHNLKIRDESIGILLAFAQGSISKPKEHVQAEQTLLNLALERLEVLEDQIKELEQKIEALYIKLDGVVLLTVQGIGLVTGAELVAEMGDLMDFDHAGQLIKLAGTNPVIKQSGDRKPTYYAISKQGRCPLRNIVFQVGKSVSVNNPEMNLKYEALKERGKHPKQAYIALGNRVLRLAFSMIKNQTLYQTDAKGYVLYSELSKKLSAKHVKYFFERYVMPKAS